MAKESIHAVMKAARLAAELTQQQLAERMETQQGVVSSRETGAQQGIPHEQLERLVAATGQSLTITPEGWALYQAQPARLPCYGPAPCGTPLHLDDDEVEPEPMELADLIDERLVADRHVLLRAQGDSMKPWINDGDLMVVDRHRVPQMNDIVAANVNEGLTVKRIAPHPQSGEPCLAPDNPAHDPIEIGDGDEVEVIGVVIGVLRRYIRLTGPDPFARAQQARRLRR